jgi:hypothetical protein
MKAKKILKLGIGLLLLICIGLISLKSFAHKKKAVSQDLSMNTLRAQDTISSTEPMDANVTVTLNSKTTDDQIDDIVSMLKENHITPSITHIERNDNGELTSIQIKLSDGLGNQAASEISSYQPISEIVFGRKDGNLFITQGDNNIFAFFDKNGKSTMGAQQDSLLNAFGMLNLNRFFNNDNDGDSFFINGKTMNIDQLRKQMEQQFGDQLNNQNFPWFNHNGNINEGSSFNFIDDPNTNKLIVIDGKISDFDHLNTLAKEHKIKAVDELKPQTAISVYGNKAKDGAIIATTKG